MWCKVGCGVRPVFPHNRVVRVKITAIDWMKRRASYWWTSIWCERYCRVTKNGRLIYFRVCEGSEGNSPPRFGSIVIVGVSESMLVYEVRRINESN